MILYLSVIGAAMVVIAGLDIAFTQLSPLYCILAVVINTVAVIALDGLEAWLIRRLPERWFSADNPKFDVTERECGLYRKLGVRKWRDKVPELGGFTHFSKSKVADPSDNNYLGRFVLEANYGVIIHLVNALSGFLIIFICPLKYALCFGVPIGAVNLVLSLMPVIVLRYNVPKLKALMRRNERRRGTIDEQ